MQSNKDNNSKSRSSSSRIAMCALLWLPLAKMDGQIFSGRSGQLQQQLSAREREREGGDQRWSEAAGSCQVETYATLQNYQCGNQFHQFSLFPIGRNRNIFVIRLELKYFCGSKGKENFNFRKVFIYKVCSLKFSHGNREVETRE